MDYHLLLFWHKREETEIPTPDKSWSRLFVLPFKFCLRRLGQWTDQVILSYSEIPLPLEHRIL